MLVARRPRTAVISFALLSLPFIPDAAPAQEYLNPNVGGCSLGTDKTVVDRSVGGRSITLPGDGTVGTITFDTDGIADGSLDAEVTGSCRQEGNRVTVFARGRVVNRAAFVSNTQASAGFSLNMRPHAKPINTDYLFRATGGFKVTWDRGDAGDPGGASAGIAMTNCIGAGSPSMSASAGSAAQGVAVSSGTLECRRGSSNPFGFLDSDVPVWFGANVHQFAGNPQEFTFEGSVVFELLRVGKELRVVAGPTQGLAGAAFPGPFVVSVADNGNHAPISGEPVRFRLLDSGGAELQAVDTTTLGDGKASANFTPSAGGIYKVEAVCAGCPASSQELGQGSKVMFPPVDVASPPAPRFLLMKPQGKGSGDNQRGLVDTEASLPLKVRVVDSGGVPQGRVAVRFILPDGAVFEVLTVEGSGEASFKPRFPGLKGTYIVEALCGDCASGSNRQQFALTAMDSVPAPLKPGQRTPELKPGSCKTVLRGQVGPSGQVQLVDLPPVLRVCVATLPEETLTIRCAAESFDALANPQCDWQGTEPIGSLTVDAGDSTRAQFLPRIGGEMTLAARLSGQLSGGGLKLCVPTRHSISAAFVRVLSLSPAATGPDSGIMPVGSSRLLRLDLDNPGQVMDLGNFIHFERSHENLTRIQGFGRQGDRNSFFFYITVKRDIPFEGIPDEVSVTARGCGGSAVTTRLGIRAALPPPLGFP